MNLPKLPNLARNSRIWSRNSRIWPETPETPENLGSEMLVHFFARFRNVGSFFRSGGSEIPEAPETPANPGSES